MYRKPIHYITYPHNVCMCTCLCVYTGANFYVPLAPALDPINYSAVEEPCDEGEECEASDLSESDLQQRPKSEAVKRAERAMSVDPQPVAHRNASR